MNEETHSMRKTIAAIITLLCVAGTFPSSSHAFGLLKVIFDGIANQVGLDRGSIPKAMPKQDPQPTNQLGVPQPKNPEAHGAYIRAEGF